MKFDRTSIIAIIVFFAFVLIFDRHMKDKYPHKYEPPAAGEAVSTSPSTSTNLGSKSVSQSPEALKALVGSTPNTIPTIEQAKEPLAELVPASELTFENPQALWRVDQRTGGFAAIELKGYRREFDGLAEDEAIDLVQDGFWIQALVSGEQPEQKNFHVLTSEKPDNTSRTLSLQRRVGDIQIVQIYRFPESGYLLSLDMTYTNIGAQTLSLDAAVVMEDSLAPIQASNDFTLPGMPMGNPSLVAVTSQDSYRYDSEAACEEEDDTLKRESAAQVYVLGLDLYYFLKAWMPSDAVVTEEKPGVSRGLRGYYALEKQVTYGQYSCRYRVRFGQNFGFVAPGESVTLRGDVFTGPKDYRITEAYHPKLTETIDLGWFGFLARPMLYVLHIFHDWTGNYGVAIILLTLVLKIIFFPLTRSASVSMYRSRKFQPQIKGIREKYKTDLRKQQMEIMAFMSKHKISPFKGCLPILPQMPVFFALYRVLSSAVELRHAPFFAWIQDLSARDPWFVIPILMAVAMYFQQKLSPTMGMDEMQRKIMQWIPVIFGVMMLGLPVGLVIYMLTNTVVSIGQQYYLNGVLEAADKASQST